MIGVLTNFTHFLFKLKFYKFYLLWVGYFFGIIGIIIAIQYYLFNYHSFGSELLLVYTVAIIFGFCFLFIFMIFSFVKFYDVGKKNIELILEKTPSIKFWLLFTIVSVIINTEIVLLIRTGALDYIFTIFPQVEILDQFLETLESDYINQFFTTKFDTDLIFKFSFSSIGAGILLLLNNIRYLEKKKNSHKFPGTRLLMIFLFLALVGILVRINTLPMDPFEINSTYNILNNVITLTVIFSSVLYLIDNYFFLKLKIH